VSHHSVETLGPQREALLAELEELIDSGLHTFERVGNALLTIRDQRLYLDHYDNFEDYCHARWEMPRSRAYQLMSAAQVAEALSKKLDNGHMPKNEAQYRALWPLVNRPEEMAATITELQEEHGDRLTAETVRMAVEEKLRRDKQRQIKQQRRLDKQLRKTGSGYGAWAVDTADISAMDAYAVPRCDAMITDPPYGQAALPLYGDLADFASKRLKPGGDLVVLTGQSYLPDVLKVLCTLDLVYRWVVAYLTPGGQATQVWERRVQSFWKPAIWLTKGHRTSGDWIGDVATSPTNDNDKRFHKWGQSVDGMDDLLQRFTDAGDTVCDPFCGGGSIGVAAVASGRSYIGFDIDSAAVQTTTERLQGLEPLQE
jgi:16S rRNA G966 N2-methylase RsmD